jgi:exonuclease III
LIINFINFDILWVQAQVEFTVIRLSLDSGKISLTNLQNRSRIYKVLNSHVRQNTIKHHQVMYGDYNPVSQERERGFVFVVISFLIRPKTDIFCFVLGI